MVNENQIDLNNQQADLNNQIDPNVDPNIKNVVSNINNRVDFNIKSYLPVLATIYGEAANQDFNSKIEVASTILNRAHSGLEEFGANNGKITDVLSKGYYSYSKQSPKFLEAMNQKFPDKASMDSFKETVAVLSGLLSGKIKRTYSVFMLTPKEIDHIKKNKVMNMDLLEKTGENKTWNFYRYKPTPLAKDRSKGRK